MNRSTRAPLHALATVLIALTAFFAVASVAYAAESEGESATPAESATPSTTSAKGVVTTATTEYPGVKYEKETLQQYEQQLAKGEIESTEFNKKVRSLHIKLKDGRYVIVHYSAGEEPKLESQLTGKGVKVAVLSKTAADKEAKKPAKHKLRYIAGGILLVVIIVVAVVLVVDRKRKREAE